MNSQTQRIALTEFEKVRAIMHYLTRIIAKVSISTIGYTVDGKPVFETAIFGGFWGGMRLMADNEKDARSSHSATVDICKPVNV